MPPDHTRGPAPFVPAGFCVYKHQFKDPQDQRCQWHAMSLVLPTPLANTLEAEWVVIESECLRNQEEERQQRARDAEEARQRLLRPPAAASSSIPSKAPRRPRGSIAVFDWNAARERLEMLRTRPTTPDKDANKRDIAIYEGLLKAGPWRRVALPRDWRDRLDALASEMQHFSAVLTFIAQRLALAELSGAPLVPPPILLLGEPGVGKTHFTHRLAEILGTPVHRECFDNAEASSGLRGSSRYWGNTHYGALFRLIALGKHANPIVLLDEIDKSRPNGHGRNPSDALLTLLEPVSNARVKDESVELEMDCSHVWYIATANNPTHIPGPLRSRFSEFAIGEPDIDGRLALAHAIFSGTLERLLPKHSQRAHFRPLTDLQICRLAWHTPRQIRMAVENAIGAAALERRWHLEDRDFDDALQKRPMPGGATASSGRRGKGDPGDGVAIVLLPV